MASIINADTTNGLKLISDTSGQLELQSAGSTKVTVNTSGNMTVTGNITGSNISPTTVTATNVNATNLSATDLTLTGEMTKPNQCYFRVRTDSGTSGQTGTIPWTNEVVDIGNNFASNQFTAPVDGNYFFAHHSLAGNNGNLNNDIAFYVNGTEAAGTKIRQDEDSANWNSYQLVAILNLSANDTVSVRVVTGQVYANSITWTSFYGYLLG
jgi:hypothetical protein